MLKRIVGAAVCLFVLMVLGSTGALAGGSKFKDYDAAFKAAQKSGKPLFVLSYMLYPVKSSDNPDNKAEFDAALAADKEMSAEAAKFELGAVNVYSNAAGYNNQFVDSSQTTKHGWPCTVRVYFPGSKKHVFEKSLTKYGMGSPTPNLSKEAASEVLKEAVVAVDKLAAPVNEILKSIKDDKALKKDVDTQLKLVAVYEACFQAVEARAAYDTAIKLIKKADKEDSRIADLTFAAAEFEAKCEEDLLAVKSLGEFAKKFNDHRKAGTALVMQAACLGKLGDFKQAKAVVESVLKDDEYKSSHEEANKALIRINAMESVQQDKRKGGG